jgi:REP element-mobilizing transposase RayT
MRRSFRIQMYGYVVMPEHVHRWFVRTPEDWVWSSFRHYATGVEGGSRLSQNGRHENANERWGDFVQR